MPLEKVVAFEKHVATSGGSLDILVDRIAAAKGTTKELVLLSWASQTSGGPIVT